MKEKFDWKTFLKNVAVIAIPVALQNLLTTTGTMVDTMMIAPLGETSVGAVGLCAQFSTLMFSCYWGFVGGGMLFFAQYWGAKDDKGIKRAYGTTLSFMMLVAAIFTTLALFFPSFVMSVYTDKRLIGDIGVGYLKIAGLAYPFQIFSMAMSAVLRSTERVKIPLFASVASVCTNIFLNWVFIYGKLGAPEMGVRGAALATVCAAVVNSLVILLAARVTKYPYIFGIKEHFDWDKAWMKEYLGKCFPIICNELLVGIGFTVNNIVLGRQSEQAIAAIAVFRTLEGFVIAFFSGFSNASAVLVGKNVGAGQPRTAYEQAKRLIFLCGSCIALVCAVLFAVHKPVLTAMSLSGESYRLGTGFLGIYCIAAIIRMCNWAQNDTYRAGGDAAFGTILEITFMYLMVIPCVCLSGLVFKANVFLVFALCYVDEPIRLVIMQVHMYSGKWIKPVTQQGKEAVKVFLAEKRNKKA